jgi:hypothetical protein
MKKYEIIKELLNKGLCETENKLYTVQNVYTMIFDKDFINLLDIIFNSQYNHKLENFSKSVIKDITGYDNIIDIWQSSLTLVKDGKKMQYIKYHDKWYLMKD